MKKLHLICNAHIDPLWLWDWTEGIGAGISTFAAAADMAEEFDFIFCHNESLLYEAVKKYEPELFMRIKSLVKAGKWHIMGGWYLQPDCNSPSGETINRCIQRGLKFFGEEFGVRPTVACSFDAFGHSRGIVQILTGNGYNGYFTCRPTVDDRKMEEELFFWDGCDGSEIKTFRAGAHYNSVRGEAVNKIKESIKDKNDVFAMLWGIGNHGGGPSRKDLAEIREYAKECEVELVHSTPERFFDEADFKAENRLKSAFQGCMPGCYASMSVIKRKFRRAESLYYATEALATYNSLSRGAEYPSEVLDGAMENILKCSFHDILPGSCIKAGEEFGLNALGSAIHSLEDIRLSSMLSLMKGQPKAADGEYPVFVFNPEPTCVKTIVNCEFTLADQNYGDYWLLPEVRFEGKRLPCQLIRERANLPLDWIKNIIFECELPPMSLSRFSVTFTKGKRPIAAGTINKDAVSCSAGGLQYVFNDKTGLLNKVIFGKRFELSGDIFRPVLYADIPDPWMMEPKYQDGYKGKPEAFRLMSKQSVRKFIGAGDGSLPAVHITEKGEVMTRVESLFEKNSSRVRMAYTFYNNRPEIDVEVGVLWNERNSVLKLELPVGDGGIPISQGMLGHEPLIKGGAENSIQKWTGVSTEGGVFGVINDGIYGCSFKDGVLSLTLLRGATYSSYPLDDLPMLRGDGYVPSMDLGWHEFKFKIGMFDENEIDIAANRFNTAPYAANLYPVDGGARIEEFPIRVYGDGIETLAVKRKGDGALIRLYRCGDSETDAVVKFGVAEKTVHFGKFEVVTLFYDGEKLEKTKYWEV